jgi:hypothetical protein
MEEEIIPQEELTSEPKTFMAEARAKIAETEAREEAFWANVDQRKAAIESKLGKRVLPIVILEIGKPENYVVGFTIRPDLVTQLRLSDRGQQFQTGFSMEEAHKVLESLLLKAESDPRITPDTEEGEMYWKAAIICLYEFIKTAVPIIKKN